MLFISLRKEKTLFPSFAAFVIILSSFLLSHWILRNGWSAQYTSVLGLRSTRGVLQDVATLSALKTGNISTLHARQVPGVGNVPPPWEADPERWNGFVCKGRRLAENMRLQPREMEARGLAASPWKTLEQAEGKGWTDLFYARPVIPLKEDMKAIQDALGFSVDHENTERHHWKHLNTGAYYDGYQNVKQGFMIMHNNRGPKHTGIGSRFPHLVPEINQLSDMYFIAWAKGHKNAGLEDSIAPPKWIIQEHIVNDPTRWVMERLPRQSTSWPGLVFYPPQDEFYALLGTPNGGSAAWLLMQHKEEFGVKEVKSIRIVAYNKRWTMIQETGELSSELVVSGTPEGSPSGPGRGPPRGTPKGPPAVPPPVVSKGERGLPLKASPKLVLRGLMPKSLDRLEEPQNDGHISNGLFSTVKPSFLSPTSLIERRTRLLGPHYEISELHARQNPIPSEQWNAFKCKGQKLIDLMRLQPEELEQRGIKPSPWTRWEDLEEQDWDLKELYLYFGLEGDIKKLVSELGITLTEDDTFFLSWTAKRFGARYNGIFSAKEGIIVMDNNKSPVTSPNWEASMSNTRIHRLSDVYFLQWKEECENAGLPIAAPKWIVRSHIINQDTRSVLNTIELTSFPGSIVYPNDELFQAFMGTPNGVGAAWFLIQHKQFFGVKTIVSIRIYKEETSNPMAVLEIGDPQSEQTLPQGESSAPKGGPSAPKGEQPLSKGEPSAPKSLQSNRLLSSNVHKKKIQLLPAALLSFPNSSVKLYQTVHASHANSIAGLRGRQVPEPLEYEDYVCKGAKYLMLMRLTPQELQQRPVSFRASPWTDWKEAPRQGWSLFQSTTIYMEDDTLAMENDLGINLESKDTVELTWRFDKYQGEYRGYYNIKDSFIIMEENFSPANSYQWRTSAPSERPTLWHLSDMYFLIWHKLFQDAGLPTTAPKWIVRDHVVNSEARKVIDHLDIGEWPGSIYTPDQDEFKALLATPNGSGVAWLLLQHKDIFGVKTVKTIRVYQNGHSVIMILEIGDLPAEETVQEQTAQPPTAEFKLNRIVRRDAQSEPIPHISNAPYSQEGIPSILSGLGSRVVPPDLSIVPWNMRPRRNRAVWDSNEELMRVATRSGRYESSVLNSSWGRDICHGEQMSGMICAAA